MALVLLVLCLVMPGSLFANPPGQSQFGADTALIVAVDVSQSVDLARYRLQMEGIAQALEDSQVLDVILSGPQGGILFAMVSYADNPRLVIDWQHIASKTDAARVAGLIRNLPHIGGEFTCLTRMMRRVKTHIVPNIPVRAIRTVLDVSGDGIDNCTDLTTADQTRNELLSSGITINGLPILVEGENNIVGSGAYRAPGYGLRPLPRGPDTDTTTLDEWYGRHVIGGPGAFMRVAKGYKDFGRAFRQKFVIEISGIHRRQLLDLITSR